MENDQAVSSASLVNAGVVSFAVETGAFVISWARALSPARATANAIRARNRICSSSQRHGQAHENQAKDNHRNTHQPRVTPGHAPKGVARQKQHHDGDGIGDAQGWPSVAHENERNHHRERAQEDQEKDADGTQPIILAQPRVIGWFGQLFQALIQRFHFDWLQNGRDHRWQRVRYEALRFFWISGFTYGAKRE